jgi:hypothetical protein
MIVGYQVKSSAQAENQQSIKLLMILPTDDQLQFMRSREVERPEIENRPMTREKIEEKSGFGEARRVLRVIGQK